MTRGTRGNKQDSQTKPDLLVKSVASHSVQAVGSGLGPLLVWIVGLNRDNLSIIRGKYYQNQGRLTHNEGQNFNSTHLHQNRLSAQHQGVIVDKSRA